MDNLIKKINMAKSRHRNLHDQIVISEKMGKPELEIANMKKRKLKLKDQIQILENKLNS
jgi:hypothetical protein